jgi:hypothetical protein
MVLVPLAQPVHANDDNVAAPGWVAVDPTSGAPIAITASAEAPAVIDAAREEPRIATPRWTGSNGCVAGCDDLARNARRPIALPILYAGLGVMQGLDLYSTVKAMNYGAVETNPVMAGLVGNRGASIAMKAGVSTAMIYFTERLRKKNPRAAVAAMVAINSLTAVVAAHNFRNARALAARR